MTDGGFSDTFIDVFPKQPLNRATRSLEKDMDLAADIVYRIGFTNCHKIAPQGLIQIKIPAENYTSI